jgi:hypothetical protein
MRDRQNLHAASNRLEHTARQRRHVHHERHVRGWLCKPLRSIFKISQDKPCYSQPPLTGRSILRSTNSSLVRLQNT